MTMGPWGQHYERTQTWWDWTPAWHEYLARCQYLLRQGLFVADICYLQPEAPPQGFGYHDRARLRLGRVRHGGGAHAHVGQGRPHRAARRHELPRAGAALVADDDAGPAAQGEGTGRGRRDGARAEALRLAQPQRLSAVRRGGEAACRGAVGRLDGQQDEGASPRQGPRDLEQCRRRRCWRNPAFPPISPPASRCASSIAAPPSGDLLRRESPALRVHDHVQLPRRGQSPGAVVAGQRPDRARGHVGGEGRPDACRRAVRAERIGVRRLPRARRRRTTRRCS